MRMPKTARYGVQGAWIKKSVNRDAQCTNTYFGQDPKCAVRESCQVQAAVTAPPPPPPPPAPAPAPALPSPLSPPTVASPVTIALLGSPHILLADTATMERLRSAHTCGAPSAVRFKSIVDAQLADPTHNKYWAFKFGTRP